MLKKRGAGVLLHISSMPSEYGVGVFEENVFHFIDKIAEMGLTYWQVFPGNPLDGANSSYCSPSAFAGNYLFVNPKGLFDMNLVSEEDYKSNIYTGTPYTADYEFAAEKRLELLKKAFLNIDDDIAKEIKEFEINNSWLTDYSVFMAVKEQENMKPWWEWSDKHAHYFECIKDIYSYEESAAFWKFVQYIFYRQWNEIKSYANKKGIAVIGDMPIYVAGDSADVWANWEIFKLDSHLEASDLAGCPPDYFSPDGQLWGNPVYDWRKLKKEKYAWWIERLNNSFKIYDIVRIDHFRGFESYYSIKAGSKTARKGAWRKGGGKSFFDALPKEFNDRIIAENLGFLTDEVDKLLEYTGFPGMKVLQFSFDLRDENSKTLPDDKKKNNVVYTGTHDNDTILGWSQNADKKDVAYAMRYLNALNKYDLIDKMNECAMKCGANTCILTMQDLLHLGSEARMNTPSTLGNNWKWRMKKDDLSSSLSKSLLELTKQSERY